MGPTPLEKEESVFWVARVFLVHRTHEATTREDLRLTSTRQYKIGHASLVCILHSSWVAYAFFVISNSRGK